MVEHIPECSRENGDDTVTDANAERSIGRLEGKVDALVGAVNDQTEKSERRYARIYQELKQIRLDAAESRRDVADLKAQAEADKPTIVEIKKWKERLIGMHMLSGFIYATFGGALVAGWKWIAVKLGWQ